MGEPDNNVLMELPPYGEGRRACPECGSVAVRKRSVDPAVVVPYPPVACEACRHLWTPRPARWLAFVYLPFGLMLMAAAPSGLVFSGMTVWEWWGTDEGFDLVRAGYICVMGGGGILCGANGWACFRAGLHYSRR